MSAQFMEVSGWRKAAPACCVHPCPASFRPGQGGTAQAGAGAHRLGQTAWRPCCAAHPRLLRPSFLRAGQALGPHRPAARALCLLPVLFHLRLCLPRLAWLLEREAACSGEWACVWPGPDGALDALHRQTMLHALSSYQECCACECPLRWVWGMCSCSECIGLPLLCPHSAGCYARCVAASNCWGLEDVSSAGLGLPQCSAALSQAAVCCSGGSQCSAGLTLRECDLTLSLFLSCRYTFKGAGL